MQDELVQDSGGICWDVRSVSKEHVVSIAQNAWLATVVDHVRVDGQFSGLKPSHVAGVRKQLSKKGCFNICQANYVVKAILTSAVKAKFLAELEPRCLLCGNDGGPEHLFYQCGHPSMQ